MNIEKNFGDNLTSFFLKTKYNINYNNEFLGIGSHLQSIDPEYKNLIWSTGFLFPTQRIKTEPVAVRGYETLKMFDCEKKDVVVGDGGVITSLIYTPKIEKRYILGIVPHYLDYPELKTDEEKYDIFKSQVLLINVCDDVDKVINQIASCNYISSSSLHGAVVADSFGIPNMIFCMKSSKECIFTYQNGFKFTDYYSSFEEEFKPPYFFEYHTSLDYLISNCKVRNSNTLKKLQSNLVKTLDDVVKKIY